MKAYVLAFLLLITTGFGTSGFAAPYSAPDVLAFTRISEVVASPDGKEVAFVTFTPSTTNPSNWQYTLSLNNKGNTTQIAQADYIGSVNWSPDGTSIAYIAINGSQQTISDYQLKNQKILSLVTLSRSIDSLAWSPSGNEIAFVADQEPQNNSPTNNTLINVADGLVNSCLYLITDIQAKAPITLLTPPSISISPGVLTNGFDWSPNSQNIAFTYQPNAKTINDSNTKVAILNLTSQQWTTLDFCNTHACNQPLYSPDGHWLAFAANISASGDSSVLLGDIGTQNQICLVDQADQTRCLQNNTTPNGSPIPLAWNPNSQAIYVGDQYRSTGPKIYELSLIPGVPPKLISTPEGGFIEPMTLTMNNTHTVFGFGYESINQAPEVFTAAADNFELTQITHMNTPFDKSLGNEQVIHWSSTDGTQIEGLLITPVGFDAGQQYPLYVDIHGGPASAKGQRYLGGCEEYSQELPTTTCTANILSLGYIIFQPNYRGSNGYGLDFRVKNFQDFGGGDYNDVMSGIDYLIQQGFVDKNQIVITGWSYGGYLTAWAISQSNLFDSAIDADGFTDFISYTGTSDDTDFFLRYLGAYFWDADQPLYWQRSPIAYVKNIQTPLLILQGGQDTRVPPSQSEELYNALTVLNNSSVEMLVAPNQAHEPTDPATISAEIDAIDQWLQGGSATSTAKK